MIPTRYRHKIPQMVSYPVGAKVISEALVDVPQVGHLEIVFWWPKHQHQYAHSGRKTRYPVLQLEYGKPLPWGDYEPRWTIRVWAVLQAAKQFIQESLVGEALPEVRRWLMENADAYLAGRLGLWPPTFFFDEHSRGLSTGGKAWA